MPHSLPSETDAEITRCSEATPRLMDNILSHLSASEGAGQTQAHETAVAHRGTLQPLRPLQKVLGLYQGPQQLAGHLPAVALFLKQSQCRKAGIAKEGSCGVGGCVIRGPSSWRGTSHPLRSFENQESRR